MSSDWVVRTDFSNLKSVIMPSLKEGSLRQGWGYQDNQDLDVIGPVIVSGNRSELDDAQKATWRRVQHWWPEHWDPVSIGDRILLPKIPARGRWGLVEVTGEYRYERHRATGDHGHILPIRILVNEIAPTNVAVSADLQRTMRNPSPTWNISALGEDIDRIIAAGEGVKVPDGPTDRLAGILNDTRDALLPRIRKEFQANQLEVPVHRLLEQVYPGADVRKKAGPAERGADFVVVETDPVGIERVTVIQLKDHQETLDGNRALEQIREAFDAYSPVSTAIVLTTAIREDPDFARRREELSAELGIPIETVLGQTLAGWFLSHLDAVVSS